MASDSATSYSNAMDSKFFTWKKIEKPKEKALKEAPAKLSSGGIVVPPIPKHLWSKNVNEEKIREEQSRKLTRQAFNNPLVPLGMAATTGCLIGMIASSLQRNSQRTQYYMRGRIVAQGLTIATLVIGAWYIGDKRLKIDGQIPPPPSSTSNALANFFAADSTQQPDVNSQ